MHSRFGLLSQGWLFPRPSLHFHQQLSLWPTIVHRAFSCGLQVFWSNPAGTGQLPSPLIIGGILLLTLSGRQFDVMALGNDMASGLGLGKAPAIIGLLSTVVLSGAAVSIAGPIGFIGLAVPNFLRAAGFHRHGILLPAAGLLGAVSFLRPILQHSC